MAQAAKRHSATRKNRSIGAMQFEPWKLDPKANFSNERFRAFAITTRLAYTVMGQTKEKLVEGFTDNKMVEAMLSLEDSIRDAAKFYDAMKCLCEAASARLLTAAHAALESDEKQH